MKKSSKTLLLMASAALLSAPIVAMHTGSHTPKPSQSYLGVDIVDVEPEQVSVLHLHDSKGAEITRVDHDGPAGKAGLREHDVILKVNDQTIENEEQFRKALRETPAGHNVALTLSRDGQMLSVTAQLANRAEVERRAWEQHYTVPEPQTTENYPPVAEAAPAGTPIVHGFITGHLLWTPYTGLMMDTMGAQLAEFFGAKNGKGLLVHSVEANSPAAMAGVRAGDVVVRVNGGTIGSKADWARAVRDAKGRPAEVTLLRERHEVTVMMPTDGKKRSSLRFPGASVAKDVPAPVIMACLELL
ncbi:PDZ domain-containing protein [Terriglobus saanensis]|uniref:PDZ/DHR/GLGF domain protein n=1 Tax=Terriglobus saanensis (strain ATCC BAA-1853 / DSM 23119 / SP1PR4) TaxID=401053 RepID=E8V8M9_TERSS|nr:PDZ domain-containing protein [Terriglobus saanensis]ADV84066.1 PDZ/DHR/GLGF domain protein [Terriglobus saanensis SP1PR4]